MSTRSQRKSNKSDGPVTPQKLIKRIENSWILLLPDQLLSNDGFTIITLPHPASGNSSKYCLDSINKKMYEVVTFNEPYRSWFIGETVKSDGSVHLVTPVNPLYLVLPRLKDQCSNRAMPLEDLLSEKGFDKIIDYVHNLDCIGDIKGPTEMKAYKYNEEKTLTWLEGKVRQLAKVLRQKNIHVTSGAASATFVASNLSSDTVNEDFFLKYANGIISEYLEINLAEQLEQRFNFKPDLIESIGSKRKSELDIKGPNKKFKSEAINDGTENIADISNQITLKDNKAPKVLTAKEKARQKAASGTKTISAFFKKK